jgi:hypothetical protein
MVDQQYRSCLEACYDCADACDRCAVACLAEPNVGKMERCVRLDMDCAQICRLAAAYMARDSEMADLIWEICAQVCDTCAEECSRHAAEHCQRCAEACRHCAEECRMLIADLSKTQADQSRRPRASRVSTH